MGGSIEIVAIARTVRPDEEGIQTHEALPAQKSTQINDTISTLLYEWMARKSMIGSVEIASVPCDKAKADQKQSEKPNRGVTRRMTHGVKPWCGTRL